MAIWLVEEIDQEEHHMRYHHMETLADAKLEFKQIIKSLQIAHKQYPNTYFYESDEPLYGYQEYEFDLGEVGSVFKDLGKLSK